MSLEAASWIKDLVSSNPEGTDPKSQGDDHLRMIKAVLKGQFSGMTQGKAIILTEDMLNRFGGGTASMVGVFNIDTILPHHAVFGRMVGTTGTFPPGSVEGDTILHLSFDGNAAIQVCFCLNTGVVWYRRNYGTLSAWFPVSPPGIGQTWKNVSASRAFNSNFTNTLTRPINIAVSANAASGGSLMQLFVEGIIVSAATTPNNLTTVTVSGTIPPGALYAVNVTAAMAGGWTWAELS